MANAEKQRLLDYIETLDGLQIIHITNVLIEDAKQQLALEDEIIKAYENKIISANYVLWHYRNLIAELGEGA